jgi:CHAT domain-containing protein
MSEYRNLLSRIEREHLASGLVQQISSVQVAEVQAELKPREALLQYIIGPESAYVILVTSDRIKGFPLSPPNELIAKTEQTQRNIKRLRSLDRVNRDLTTLSAMILAPVTDSLKDTEKLVIIPGGPLYGLPFAALPVGEEVLTDRFELTVANSASSWIVSRQMDSQGKGSLVAALGNVQGRGDRLTPLPGTEGEAQLVSAALPNSVVFLAHEMVSEKLRSSSVGKNNLHYATHGVLDEEEPLLSGLECHDQRITAAEIFGWDLDAKLAVLSACNSGEFPEGNSYLGLSSAFQYAGVRTLVVSLWPVSDEATKFWMEQFYVSTNEGRSPSAAMRAAHLKTREKWPHPYYWAPFTTWGDGLTNG